MGFKENMQKIMASKGKAAGKKPAGKGGRTNKGLDLMQLRKLAKAAKGRGDQAPMPEGMPPRR